MPLNIFVFRLATALLAGIIIGTQRELRQHQAGLTTNALVAVGACIFILISESVIMSAIAAGGPVNNDNLRVLSQVVTGIGFLGAGVIMKNGVTIHGLSSAATILLLVLMPHITRIAAMMSSITRPPNFFPAAMALFY